MQSVEILTNAYFKILTNACTPSSETDNIDYKSMYATHLNLITQNRELFESRDQSSIDEAIIILEDLDPDEVNF